MDLATSATAITGALPAQRIDASGRVSVDQRAVLALALPLMFQPLAGVPIITQIHLGTGVNSFGNAIAESKTDQLANALELSAILGANAVYAATGVRLRRLPISTLQLRADSSKTSS